MTANKNAVKLAMARACMNVKDVAMVAEMPEATIKNFLFGRAVRTATAGRIARALNVDVAEIIETETEE